MYIIDKVKNYSHISLILAILASFFWLIPIIGYVLSILAIGLAYKSLELEDNYGAIAGISLGIISLILSVLRSGLVFFYG